LVIVVFVITPASSSFVVYLFFALSFIHSSQIFCLIIFCLFITSSFISAITDLRSVLPSRHANTIQVACPTGHPITPAPPLPLPLLSLSYCTRLIVVLVDQCTKPLFGAQFLHASDIVVTSAISPRLVTSLSQE
jgi:hypothetical protein